MTIAWTNVYPTGSRGQERRPNCGQLRLHLSRVFDVQNRLPESNQQFSSTDKYNHYIWKFCFESVSLNVVTVEQSNRYGYFLKTRRLHDSRGSPKKQGKWHTNVNSEVFIWPAAKSLNLSGGLLDAFDFHIFPRSPPTHRAEKVHQRNALSVTALKSGSLPKRKTPQRQPSEAEGKGQPLLLLIPTS